MPEHAVTLAEVQGQIAVMFRALGGETGVQFAGARARKSGHRLGWRQRIGLGDESSIIRAATAQRSSCRTASPCFPIATLNALLYRWLAAWFATAPVAGSTRPTRCGAIFCPAACPRDRRNVLAQFPGLVRPYARLAAATAMARPRRPLPRIEQEVERIVLALLGADTPPEGGLWPAVIGAGAAAGEGAARLSADAALSAVGRLLDARGCRGRHAATTTRPRRRERSRRAGHAQALRRPRARGRRQARSVHPQPLREDPRDGGDGQCRPPIRRQRGRGRPQGGRRSRRTRDRQPQRQARDAS